MCGDALNFPETPEEFIKEYSFKDKQEVYTNGAELISVFRVKQMLEKYFPVRRGAWVDHEGKPVEWDNYCPESPARSCYCNQCGEWLTASDEYSATGLFCPHCGAKMYKED